MKLGFIIPVMAEYDVEKALKTIKSACAESKSQYEIIFAINNKMNTVFTKIREVFVENEKVKAFRVDKSVNEYKLITVAMEYCEKYDATIIYSAKEEINEDVVKAFITSWQAGNKIVYLRKVYFGFKKVWQGFKDMFYRLGVKMIGIFKDMLSENDTQLLDLDVVRTINQLQAKNQQLRTLDSFIGYTTDIVHLEVDSRVKNNPAYQTKTKKYTTNSILAYSMFSLSFISAIVSILGLSLKWNLPVFVHVIFWFIFVVTAVLSLSFYTKKRLNYRVGEMFDLHEIKSLTDKIETYNM